MLVTCSIGEPPRPRRCPEEAPSVTLIFQDPQEGSCDLEHQLPSLCLRLLTCEMGMVKCLR